MKKIRDALEKRGIEFVGNYGVQKRQVNFQVLDTRDNETALPKLWDDVFDTLKDKRGEVLISHFSEKDAFEAHPEKLRDHLDRLKRHNITERLLVCEDETMFIQDIECYRVLKRDIYRTGMPCFLYGTKLAFQFWNGRFILIVDHPEIHQEEKQRFEHLWANAMALPQVKMISKST